MKTLCLLFFLLPTYLFGQQVFYSPYTETYPTIFKSKIEKVDRRITFEPNTITIATETKEGKDIEVLVIQGTDHANDNLVFLCRNKSKERITISIPEHHDRIQIIDYYYRSPQTKEETLLRFYVERIR